MNLPAPALSSRNLVLAAVSALGLGLLGGVAANPVMKPPHGSDWRERYRAVAVQPVDDGADFAGAYGYGYGYGLAARLVDAGAVRFAEGASDLPAVGEVDDTEPALIAGPEPDLSALDSRGAEALISDPPDGRAVVEDALARTDGAFDRVVTQTDSDAPEVGAAAAVHPGSDDRAPGDDAAYTGGPF